MKKFIYPLMLLFLVSAYACGNSTNTKEEEDELKKVDEMEKRDKERMYSLRQELEQQMVDSEPSDSNVSE
jgi:hypothetical protein